MKYALREKEALGYNNTDGIEVFWLTVVRLRHALFRISERLLYSFVNRRSGTDPLLA